MKMGQIMADDLRLLAVWQSSARSTTCRGNCRGSMTVHTCDHLLPSPNLGSHHHGHPYVVGFNSFYAPHPLHTPFVQARGAGCVSPTSLLMACWQFRDSQTAQNSPQFLGHPPTSSPIIKQSSNQAIKQSSKCLKHHSNHIPHQGESRPSRKGNVRSTTAVVGAHRKSGSKAPGTRIGGPRHWISPG